MPTRGPPSDARRSVGGRELIEGQRAPQRDHTVGEVLLSRTLVALPRSRVFVHPGRNIGARAIGVVVESPPLSAPVFRRARRLVFVFPSFPVSQVEACQPGPSVSACPQDPLDLLPSHYRLETPLHRNLPRSDCLYCY